MSVQQVHSEGIYHGLPTYPEETSGLTAIITGANGISGHYMLRVLAKHPERWSKIYCLSRRPPLIPGGLPSNAEHVPLDFLKDPKDIAVGLTNAGINHVDHVFFYSYIQPPPKEGAGLWSDVDELVRVNSLLLDNFLAALKAAGLKPERFMLQTGAKHYGVHLGPVKQPMEETDPRVELEPNFYYPQEDALFKYCSETGAGWNVGMPGAILGAVPDAAMNLCFPLAVYAAVTRHLKQPLIFPADIQGWQFPVALSSAALNAYMEEWMVLSGPANQRYNVCDDSAFAYEGFWPRLAGWYGLEWEGPQEGEYERFETRFAPRQYGGKGVANRKFSLASWVKREDVKKAWAELAEEHGLVQKELREPDRVFGFAELAKTSPMAYRRV
ncbi:MAG: hypothetical protein M1820_002866 [Bogoriella megaspora]|nr:MAG: hypothetical protein M1820_002866 [Bogoriella megaspora]